MRDSLAYLNSKSVDYGIHTTNDPLFLIMLIILTLQSRNYRLPFRLKIQDHGIFIKKKLPAKNPFAGIVFSINADYFGERVFKVRE